MGLMRGVGLVLAGAIACARSSAPEEAEAPVPAPVQAPAEAKAPTPTPATTAIDYAATCKAIAKDLEKLGKDYPQLRSFDAKKGESSCRIEHDHKTHPPTGRGGWTAGVPNPDPDGVWLYIAVWDPNDEREATAQINTQPVMPNWWIGERRVTFLILEGEQTKVCGDAVLGVLQRHGLVEK